MNTRQKKICEAWSQLLWGFVQREWFSLFLSSSLGVLAAESIDLLFRDRSFQNYLVTNYLPIVSFDDPRHYIPYLALAFSAMFLAVLAFVYLYMRRGLKSWWAGVTSGLVLLPFASAFLISMLPSSRFHHRFFLGCTVVGIWFSVSFLLYLAAKIRAERTVREDEFKVPSSVRSLAGSQLEESDDPIQSWAQDALGRAALVDSLSVKIMIAKAPVLALSGAFGSGKTSTLNLLREHLGDKAITVSFSTWLPGSAEMLTSYLLADIANECKKQYVVPGLRQSARRLATALGQKVPLLSDYLKLLPAPTQKDDIENLKSALIRLPKRVVVLLDEIDRMEKEELVTLLKVIRGISTLPNLSFVCAGDRRTIVETVKGEYSDKNNEYFEKFFPVLIQVPEPDPAGLRRAGTERLVAAFVGRDWFENESDKKKFREQIEKLWDERIAPFCRNLRTIGLLANDVSFAAAPLRREVDPVDLTLIELLRRFKPVAYELVARNSLALTGGESMVRGGPFQTDEDADRNKAEFLADLKSALPDEDELEQVRGVLTELFPLLSKGAGPLKRSRPLRKDQSQESDKRISEPGMFPAYFRYEIPDAIFSSVEMASLLRRFEHAATQTARETVFLDTLQSMEKGSLKRDDFLRKLADSVKSIPVPVAKSLGEAAVKASQEYMYDTMAAFAEAGHVLRMILLIAQRLSQTERVAFLQECILNASDDTMAFRILTILTQQKDDSKIDVSVADLYASFATRMRKRYGRDVDAANFDLSASDPWALDYWGRDFSTSGIRTNPEDRKIQNDFWLRYIGNSRARLAKAFREFFLPVAAYSEDPAPLVQNRISLEDLKRLYEELPEDATLTNADLKSLALLGRFLKGEFKNGISPTSGIWRD
jgi:predicted KAP-like P-loop ATPase